MTKEFSQLRRQRTVAIAIILFSILAVAAILIGSLIFVGTSGYEKNRIRQTVSNTAPEEIGTVADCLLFWELPVFSEHVIEAIENIYLNRYYKEIGQTLDVARDTAILFLDKHYDGIDREDEAAVTKAVAASYIEAVGDEYGKYRTAEEAGQYDNKMTGTTVGIGVSVTKDVARGIPITSIVEDSPGANAGLLVGDIIVSIDGENIVGKDYNESVSKIRGEAGTEVTITVKRGEEYITFTITRAAVIENTARGEMLDGNIGYIKITNFKDNTDELFAKVLNELLDRGAVGIIFDLSVNPGGYLVTATNMLSYLTPTGTKLAGFSSTRAPIYSTEGTALEPTDSVIDVPVVVICSQHTVSAGELFTGAIKDFREMGLMESTVVGKTTYKKGVMQTSITLVNGDTVTVTTAYYYSPLGNNNDISGVAPDVIVEDETEFLTVAIAEMQKLLSN